MPEQTESLGDVDAGLSEDAWVLLHCPALKLDLLAALVVEGHLEGPLLPIPIDDNKVLSGVKVEVKSQTLPLLILATDPPIAIGPVFYSNHNPGPGVVIAIVIVIFLIFLNEAENAADISLFDDKSSQRDAIDMLFDDTAERIEIVIDTVQLRCFELFPQVRYLHYDVLVSLQVHEL